MKVDLTKISDKDFILRKDKVGEDLCVLVFPPHIGTKWNKENLIFRSSMWDTEGNPVSLGFRKFFNFHEQPDLSYTPVSTTANGGINVISKLDGSCLILSKYKGKLIARTRGTFFAEGMKNGHELSYLKEKYPKCFSFKEDTPNYSLLFEWTSPENIIVIRTDTPDIKLIGKVYHDDYSLETQDNLDQLAEELEVNRPERFSYSSIQELLDDVSKWQGSEGVCVYSKRDQEIRKIKSEWYLALHRMKSELCNIERVIDLFLNSGYPSYQDFYDLVANTLDYEIAEQARSHLSKTCDAYKEVKKIVSGMHEFVDKVKNKTSDRKNQAEEIISSYGNTNRSGFVFSILDGRELDNKALKKLLFQTIK